MNSAKPVFIHSMWRSGGTYWWGKFREKQECYCFCEPFHEDLARKDPKEFQREYESGINNALRHSRFNNHYFEEYPFNETWFKTFHQGFSWYDNYFQQAGDDAKAIQDYISNLISFANKKFRIPVLKLVRTSLRAAVLVDKFDSINIYLLRNFDEQFESTVMLNGLAPFFMVIKENRSHWFFSDLFDFLTKENVYALARNKEGKPIFTSKRQLEIYRSVLFFFWSLSLLCNLKHSDLIINHEHAEDRSYRKNLQDQIKGLTNISLDLHDYRTTRRTRLPSVELVPEVVGLIKKNILRLDINTSLLKESLFTDENRKDISLVL